MATQSIFGDPTSPASPSHYPPSQTMLLFLDYHSLFVTQLGSPGTSAVTQARKLATWARSIPDLHIGHALIDPKLDSFPTCKGQDRLNAVKQMLNDDSAGWNEPEGIRSDTDTEVVYLRRGGYVSATKSIGLPDKLAELGVKHLILCGLSTSGCVVRTACAATDAEFVVTVVEDACGDRDQNRHDVCLQMLGNRCWVMTAEQVVNELLKK
ncbi:hypothetical protein LTR66_017488 [Elasticomyces elasticus]|nr:hypothetical protein LTR66_017488 [Elasticomyces elasticus]